MITLQFRISYGWIQNKNLFICIIPNNQCWLRWCSCYGNIVIECHRLPSMSCKGYFIGVLNKFDILFTRLCIQPLLLGRLLGCQKSTNWRFLLFLSFLLLYEYLMKRYFCCNRLLRLIARSFNWLYSLNLTTCFVIESPQKQVVVAFLIPIAF